MAYCYCPCEPHSGMASATPTPPNLMVQSFDPDVVLMGPSGAIMPITKKEGQGKLWNIYFNVPSNFSTSTRYYVSRKTIMPHYAGLISYAKPDASVFQWHGLVAADVSSGYYPGMLVISLTQPLP